MIEDDQKNIEQTVGKWIAESGELKTMTGVDRARVKDLSKYTIIGTSGSSEYLEDKTQDRRYWSTSEHADGSPRGAGCECEQCSTPREPLKVDARSIICTFNGVEVKGFADGNFIEVERDDRVDAPALKVTMTLVRPDDGQRLHGLLWDDIQQGLADGTLYVKSHKVNVENAQGRTWTFEDAALEFLILGQRWAKRAARKIRMARKKRRGWA